MSGSAMARIFVVEKNVVTRYMRKNGLSAPIELQKKFRSAGHTGKTTFTTEEDEMIKANYLSIPIKTLGDKMHRSFTGIMGRLKALNLELPEELRAERKKAGMYRKGATPMNKGKKQSEYMSQESIEKTAATRFKKGEPNHNTLYDGAITIRYDTMRDGTKRPYKWIRISKANWKMLHVKIWEDEHGPVPEGKIVVFKNKNSLDVKLKNLQLITLEENMRRNTIHRYPVELKQVIRVVVKLKKSIKKTEDERQKTN